MNITLQGLYGERLSHAVTAQIANIIKSDNGTAHLHAYNTAKTLSVPVTNELFLSLVRLSYAIGIPQFQDCILLEMINNGYSKTDVVDLVEKVIRRKSRKNKAVLLNAY